MVFIRNNKVNKVLYYLDHNGVWLFLIVFLVFLCVPFYFLFPNYKISSNNRHYIMFIRIMRKPSNHFNIYEQVKKKKVIFPQNHLPHARLGNMQRILWKARVFIDVFLHWEIRLGTKCCISVSLTFCVRGVLNR